MKKLLTLPPFILAFLLAVPAGVAADIALYEYEDYAMSMVGYLIKVALILAALLVLATVLMLLARYFIKKRREEI